MLHHSCALGFQDCRDSRLLVKVAIEKGSLASGHSCLSPFLKWFTEDSDELWMRHCQRDFKRESPQEYESWREMYLRLHDEREERLKMLTQNISSAHANKPKGRRASPKLILL